MNVNRDLLIWMAGFFDGEGCVSIGRGQKDRASLALFEEAFGGALYVHRRKGMQYHRWVINSQKAADVLVQLLPYLRVKRDVAEVGIRFQEQMSAWNRQYGRTGYPPHIRDAREGFYHEAKVLNARNRPDPTAPAYEGPRAVAARAVNEE